MLLYRFFSLNAYQQMEKGFPNRLESPDKQITKRVMKNSSSAEQHRKAKVLSKVELFTQVFKEYDKDTTFRDDKLREDIVDLKREQQTQIINKLYSICAYNIESHLWDNKTVMKDFNKVEFFILHMKKQLDF